MYTGKRRHAWVSAIDGREALRRLELHPQVNIVLMDMIMPEMDGFESQSSLYTRQRFPGFAEFRYRLKNDMARFSERLSRKMIVSTHNLVSDSSFNEFQLIFCRNVLIYFNKDLQDKVLCLFDESLERLGFLALGARESLKFSSVYEKLRQLENKERIWRKIA